MNEINPDRIISDVAVRLAKDSLNAIIGGASSAMKSAWLKISPDFEPYASRIYNKNRNVRILCVRDHDVNLYDIYVSSNFRCNESIITDETLISNIRDGEKIVLNGNGGAGKTFFMRHLWLNLFESPQGKIPLFLELRNINDLSTIDLKNFIRLTISTDGGLPESVFDYFCNRGSFVFILDGFDEVPEASRSKLQEQILSASSLYSKCGFVVSSRYDKRFSGWQGFTVYQSEPFGLEQCKGLISKVPFDSISKNLFLKKLDQKFYNKHRSFLSIPLLGIMMMMTFKENMEIPQNMNIFYDQAFTTLFQWHDATKAFSRKRTLNIDEFRKSFSVFCSLSYCEEKFEFSETEFVTYILKSNKILGYTYDPADIIRDYVESVNLMQQDGLQYVFIHRSFQEYFFAHALTTILSDKADLLISKITDRYSDTSIQLSFQMNKDLIVKNYIIPGFNKYMIRLPKRFLAQNKFTAHEFLGLKYSFYSAPMRKNHYMPNFSAYIDPEKSTFIQSIIKIMDNSLNNNRDLIFDQKIMEAKDILSDFMLNNNINSAIKEIEVSFSPRSLSVIIKEAQEKDTESKISNVTDPRLLKLIEGIFVAREKEIRIQLNDLRNWCDKCIKESEKREKSIDDIFGIL